MKSLIRFTVFYLVIPLALLALYLKSVDWSVGPNGNVVKFLENQLVFWKFLKAITGV